jgi:hypothetical protein
MPKNNIPAYAIVELLMRLSYYNELIGDYKGHTVRTENVIVKTTGGGITFPIPLIMQQFNNPEMIDNDALVNVASLFKTSRSKQKTIS